MKEGGGRRGWHRCRVVLKWQWRWCCCHRHRSHSNKYNNKDRKKNPYWGAVVVAGVAGAMVVVRHAWCSRRSRSVHVVYLWIIVSRVPRKRKNIQGARDADASRAPSLLLLLPLSLLPVVVVVLLLLLLSLSSLRWWWLMMWMLMLIIVDAPLTYPCDMLGGLRWGSCLTSSIMYHYVLYEQVQGILAFLDKIKPSKSKSRAPDYVRISRHASRPSLTFFINVFLNAPNRIHGYQHWWNACW